MKIHKIDCTETNCKECPKYMNCKERFSCVASSTCIHFDYTKDPPMCINAVNKCKPYDGCLYEGFY